MVALHRIWGVLRLMRESEFEVSEPALALLGDDKLHPTPPRFFAFSFAVISFQYLSSFFKVCFPYVCVFAVSDILIIPLSFSHSCQPPSLQISSLPSFLSALFCDALCWVTLCHLYRSSQALVRRGHQWRKASIRLGCR